MMQGESTVLICAVFRLEEFRKMLSSDAVDINKLRTLCFQGMCILF